MKKTISVILACLLIAACLPLSAMAATITSATVDAGTTFTFTDSTSITGSYVVNGTVVINEGVSVRVEGGTLTVSSTGHIENNGTLSVTNGSSLILNGSADTILTTDTVALYNTGTISLESGCAFVVNKDATVYNAGTLYNFDYATVYGSLQHKITLFGTFTSTYDSWTVRGFHPGLPEETFNVTYTVKYALDSKLSSDTAYLDESNYTEVAGDYLYVDQNDTLYIMITPDDTLGDWVDASRIQLVVDGDLVSASAKIDTSRGLFMISPTDAMEVSVYSTAYKNVVKLFEISLPNTAGYYVTTLDGDMDSVSVEYGTTFSFSVVLNDEYDQSDISVYVDGVQISADEYGYYDVTGPIVDGGMSNAGGVQDSFTISVTGVAKNSTVETVNSVLLFIQQIVEVIQSIFDYFADLFSGLFS